MSLPGGNAHQKYVQTMLKQKDQVDLPKPNWTPLKPAGIAMRENLKRVEDYRAIKSLDLDNE